MYSPAPPTVTASLRPLGVTPPPGPLHRVRYRAVRRGDHRPDTPRHPLLTYTVTLLGDRFAYRPGHTLRHACHPRHTPCARTAPTRWAATRVWRPVRSAHCTRHTPVFHIQTLTWHAVLPSRYTASEHQARWPIEHPHCPGGRSPSQSTIPAYIWGQKHRSPTAAHPRSRRLDSVRRYLNASYTAAWVTASQYRVRTPIAVWYGSVETGWL